VGAPVWTNFAATSLTPNGVVGGGTVQGKVHIQNTAPAGGQVYTLTSNNPSAASVPASVTIPAGASSATYTVTTHPVSVSTPVQITVWSEGNGDHPVLWVDPGAAPPPGTVTLTSLTLNPSTVTSGNSSQGTVTLTGAAPGGGVVVSLSDDSTNATTPASVTVPAGATSATFTVTTTGVTVTTPVTVSAVASVTRTATLTLNPPPTPAAPTLVAPANAATVAQPVTLDWSDVTNATSYEVQVDNTSTISAPFVANPTVTASQATLSGLPAQQLWWRVRARNAAGAAGPFSSTRSFTPQGVPNPPGQAATLTVSATGRGGERVTSNPAGINVAVGSTGSASFTTGTSITLSVTNGRDAIWSGACSPNGTRTRTCTFTLNGNATVTANVQ